MSTGIKRLLKYVRSFFIALFGVLAISGAVVQLTIYNDAYFKLVLPQNYIDDVCKRIAVEAYGVENQIVINITGTGEVKRRTSILSNAINFEMLEQDINGYIDSSLNPDLGEYRINEAKWKNIFLNALTKYTSDKKMKLTDYQLSVFDEASEKCVEIYKNYVEFNELHENVKKASEFKTIVIVLTYSSLGLFIILLLWTIFEKTRDESRLRYLMYSTTSIGFSLIIGPIVIYSSDILTSRKFSEIEIVSNFWGSYYNGVFGYLLLIGTIIFLASFLIVLFVYPKLFKESQYNNF